MIGAGSPRAIQFLRALANAGAELTHFQTRGDPERKISGRSRFPTVDFVVRYATATSLSVYLNRYHQRFDAIIVSRRHNLIAFNAACRGRPQIAASKSIIFDSEAIFAAREALQREVTKRAFKAADFTVDEEIELARLADIVIAVNELDAAPFRAAGYGDVQVIGHAVDPAFGARPHAGRSGFLFVGPTYADETPNGDSVIWFVDRVLPLIRARLGVDIALSHVGRSTAPAVLARADGRIDAHGELPDLTGAFDRARVFVAPTRFASGIPIKVCEAAAHGVPCVITPLLARQLGWDHEREALIAETPEDFARQCLRLSEDAALWQQIRATAFERITQDCDRSRFDEAVADLCARIKAFRLPRRAGAAVAAS